jgi:uncharacterized protein YpuA (DUF1002 family)
MPRTMFQRNGTLLPATGRTMKTIIGLVMLATSVAAHASDYSAAAQQQQRCRASGELAQSVRGASKERVMKALDDAKARVKAKQLSKKKYDEFGRTVMVGVTASSDRDAYMQGWAICMDAK